MELASEFCEACKRDAPTATDDEIAELKPQIPDWEIVEVDGEKRLTRAFTFPDFKSALAFTNKIGDIAEDVGHHPLIELTWGKVTVSWWSHKIHGLHRTDFVMAARTDKAYSPA